MNRDNERRDLKDKARRLSLKMKDASGSKMREIDDELRVVLNKLDPLMGDQEAIAFYTECEKLSER